MTENKRIIKFRGKRRDNGEWVYGLLDYDSGGTCGCIRGWMGESGGEEYCTVEVISDTVGQFTGLLDKNNKEIYEGDIIRKQEYDWVVSFGHDRDQRGLGWVAYAIQTKRRQGDRYNTFFLDKSILSGEIIGNIYEDKNLLENGK